MPALRGLTRGPSPRSGEGGPAFVREARRKVVVPPLHFVERGPGGEDSEGRMLRGHSGQQTPSILLSAPRGLKQNPRVLLLAPRGCKQTPRILFLAWRGREQNPRSRF